MIAEIEKQYRNRKPGTDGTFPGFVPLRYFLLAARFARVIALDTRHHVTQRGNARQFILATDAERLVYLDLRNGAARCIAGYATLGAVLDNRRLAELSRGGYLARPS